MSEPTLRTKDGRAFVPITSPASEIHAMNEHMLGRTLAAQAIFTQPDFEVHVMCPEHGHEMVTYHEPMFAFQMISRDLDWTNPN